MLPYTNAEANAMSRSKFKHFKTTVRGTHFINAMIVAAKLLLASIATCVNGFIPSAFKYTSASICLSIIEDDLQNNRMPYPIRQKQSSLNESALNDVAPMAFVDDHAFDIHGHNQGKIE
jgi:hypothetical protein